jgi:DNA-binding transcriptional ArsR family regulator
VRTASHARAVLENSALLFAALGDATRLKLVTRLCDDGPQSIARLTDGLNLTRQGITKHLRVLAAAGLVRDSRSGRESRWQIEPRRLEIARRYLDLISERWDARLKALERYVEKFAC